jgi:hypothetical protein
MLLIIPSVIGTAVRHRRTLVLNLLGDGDVAGAHGSEEGVVAAVAVHEVVVLAALLGVACAQK